jgi:hypothetical protein
MNDHERLDGLLNGNCIAMTRYSKFLHMHKQANESQLKFFDHAEQID